MGVLPFRRHGRSREQQVRARMEAALDAWLTGWAVGNVPRDVELTRDEETRHASCMATADRNVIVVLPTGGLARLGAVLAGVPNGEDSAFAEAIGRRALTELVCVCSGTSDAASIAEVHVDPANLQSRYGVLAFRVRLDSLALVLNLSAQACDALAAPATPLPMALVQRRHALLASTVQVTATLDLGSADIDAALTLRPGEIIKATAIADAEVVVKASDGTALFKGVLDSIDGRKALRCTHVQLH